MTPTSTEAIEPIAANDTVDLTPELEERIRFRAFELYSQRGDGPGSDVDDWLQAKADVLAEVSAAPETKVSR